MAPHSSTLAWKIPWTEESGRLQSMGSLVSDTNERLHFHFSLSCVGEGNGNPLQFPCLENPRDGGAWWAAICGVAQSRTRLKRLSSSSISHPIKVTGVRVMLDGLAELIRRMFWYASSTKYIETITSQVVSPSHQLRNLPNIT